MKKKIGFIGILTNQVDHVAGPANSAKSKYAELEKHYGRENIYKVSIYNWKKRKVICLFQVVIALLLCENILLNISITSYKYVYVLLCLLGKSGKKKIHLIPIGNPIPEIESDDVLRKRLEKVDYFYFQTQTISETIRKLGFDNVYTLYNFRHSKVIAKNDLDEKRPGPVQFCTFSRVCEGKGITDAIEAIVAVNQSRDAIDCMLEIYGPLEDGYTTEFNNYLRLYPLMIHYRGVAKPEDAVETIRKYYMLLFPSRFAMEGYPGTILDAYSAGLPVISSNWLNSKEIIREGETGFVFDVQDELIRIINFAIDNPDMIMDMRHHCLDEAEALSPERCIQTLISNIT